MTQLPDCYIIYYSYESLSNKTLLLFRMGNILLKIDSELLRPYIKFSFLVDCNNNMMDKRENIFVI